MRPAISTIANPAWTLEHAAELASACGYLGLEMRTVGPGNTQLVGDPCHTAGEKTRDVLEDAGIRPVALASGIRFDEPVWPPVIGRVFGDFERPVRQTKQLVEVAAEIECPYVRVFGFELRAGESRRGGLRRIIERLELAAATARNTGVKLLIENGGSFPTAADLRELIDRVGSPLLDAAYAPAVAAADGEPIDQGLRVLGQHLAVVKLKDLRDGKAVPLGHGTLAVRDTVRSLARTGFGGWVVNEWAGSTLGTPAGQAPDEAALRELLRADAERLFGWWHEAGGGPIRDRLHAA